MPRSGGARPAGGSSNGVDRGGTGAKAFVPGLRRDAGDPWTCNLCDEGQDNFFNRAVCRECGGGPPAKVVGLQQRAVAQAKSDPGGPKLVAGAGGGKAARPQAKAKPGSGKGPPARPAGPSHDKVAQLTKEVAALRAQLAAARQPAATPVAVGAAAGGGGPAETAEAVDVEDAALAEAVGRAEQAVAAARALGPAGRLVLEGAEAHLAACRAQRHASWPEERRRLRAARRVEETTKKVAKQRAQVDDLHRRSRELAAELAAAASALEVAEAELRDRQEEFAALRAAEGVDAAAGADGGLARDRDAVQALLTRAAAAAPGRGAEAEAAVRLVAALLGHGEGPRAAATPVGAAGRPRGVPPRGEGDEAGHWQDVARRGTGRDRRALSDSPIRGGRRSRSPVLVVGGPNVAPRAPDLLGR